MCWGSPSLWWSQSDVTVSCKRGAFKKTRERTESTKERRRVRLGRKDKQRELAAEWRLIENDKMTSHEGDVCQLGGTEAGLFVFSYILENIRIISTAPRELIDWKYTTESPNVASQSQRSVQVMWWSPICPATFQTVSLSAISYQKTYDIVQIFLANWLAVEQCRVCITKRQNKIFWTKYLK